MITVQRQVHGYRQGHQLLASSVELPKADQSVIDRLSDVAGPLRPKEQFGAYLTGYPLPSGMHYVLARTWQDTKVARAGCVRTLSLIVPMQAWSEARSLIGFLRLLNGQALPEDGDATPHEVQTDENDPLPAAPQFRASELLEALFLEETKPVAVFDAPEPELIAVRLLTALWPGHRRRFAMSTFALSPRKLAGRDFDLVFAPKDARSKFADWPGRRIDGRASQDARHKWTSRIVERVFDDERPRLLSEQEVLLVGSGSDASDPAAALRIALLWEELTAKLRSTPSAALGLLDIANSGLVQDSAALGMLEGEVSRAIQDVSASFADDQAWDFLGAIVRKIQDRPMPASKRALGESVQDLSAKSPSGALELLGQPDPSGAIADLSQRISAGFASQFGPATEAALLAAPPPVAGRLIAQDARLAQVVASDRPLVQHLATIAPMLDEDLLLAFSRTVMPQLAHDWQVELARPLAVPLSASAISEQIERIGATKGVGKLKLAEALIENARAKGGVLDVRSRLEKLPESPFRTTLIAKTLEATPADLAWLLEQSILDREQADELLTSLLGEAAEHARASLVSNDAIGNELISRLAHAAPGVLQDIILSGTLPRKTLVAAITRLWPTLSHKARADLARHTIAVVMRDPSDTDQVEFVVELVNALGPNLDARWLAFEGLGADVSPPAASRNMVAFASASPGVRARIAGSVADIADALYSRRTVDLDEAAIGAFAALLEDVEKISPVAVLKAAGRLLPSLMRQRRDPVSPAVAIMFAAIYRELAKEDDVPDLLKFVPFWDWDRCKAARQELVSAFMSSSWPPGDLALTACKCGDVDRILRRTAKAYGGDAYIDRVAGDLQRLSAGCRKSTAKSISALRSDWSAKYDWRD